MLPFFLQISIIFLMIDLAPILGIQIAVIGTSCINNPKISIPSIYSSKLNPSSCTLKKIKEWTAGEIAKPQLYTYGKRTNKLI